MASTLGFSLREDGSAQLEQDEHGDGRRARWRRRTRARQIAYVVAPGHSPDERSPLKRLKSCGRAKAPDVTIRVHNSHAHASGLMACGSIWACPTCSARIRARRELELEAALREHCSSGGRISMITLTMRHTKDQRLADLIDSLNDAWRRTQRHRRFRRHLAPLLTGTVATLEVTLGENGWHPHLHVLLLEGCDTNPTAVQAAAEHLRALWSRNANARSDRWTLAYGFKHTAFGHDSARAARYVTKIAKELTLADTKSGRDPFTLLDNHDASNTALFIEYATATHGRQCHRWSAGLRRALTMDTEQTDEQLAQENAEVGIAVLTLSRELWNSLTDAERLDWIEWAEAYHRTRPAPELRSSA